MKILRSSGVMYIISSPSGAGKSSIVRELIARNKNLRRSISVTTRMQRPGEVDGIDYHFRSIEEFSSLIEKNAFIEYSEVFGNSYGTLISEVDPYLSRGMDVIFDVDWQGAQKLRKNENVSSVSIYILPPSIDSLKKRLYDRNSDSEDVIEARMEKAMREISHYHEYDYVVINDNFEDAVSEVQAIVTSERLRTSGLDLLRNFVKSL